MSLFYKTSFVPVFSFLFVLIGCSNDTVTEDTDDIAVTDEEPGNDEGVRDDFIAKDDSVVVDDYTPLDDQDTDTDNPTPWDNEDADGDGVKNGDEGTGDTDGDGTPDYLDSDSDGDGISDNVEAPNGIPVDTDKDGTPDFKDTDSDNDGIPDSVEGTGDADGDGTANYRDTDSDGDNLPDGIECPDQPCHDNDADGTPDYLDTDSDNDGVPDLYESNKDGDGDGLPNYWDTDSDGDGILDGTECPTLPCADSDGDGHYDFRDGDSDNDGLSDAQEVVCNNLGKDSRLFADTDEDGYTDLAERAVGSDLCDPAQGVKDIFEFYFVLPFQNPEQTDVLTFTPTVQKADVHFNVDTTGSMGEEINNIKSGLQTIIAETKARVADSAFGVSHFEDFPLCDFGSGGDVPWKLLQSPTTDASVAQGAVNQLSLGNGNDFPESGYEALYQLATGAGGSFSISVSGGGCDGDCSGNYTINPYTGSGKGGVGFRPEALPIAIHITDAPSHTPGDYGGSGHHSRDDAVNALVALGVRTMTIQSSSDGTAASQLTDISNSTGAQVPVCAFKTGETTWRCGADMCCTLNGGAIAPSGGKCTLRYQIPSDGTGLNTSVVDGIDAIVKYTTFNVYTAPKDDGDGNTPDTACFLKKVESLEFVPPPAEPEKSCTPVAQPAAYNGASYNNGFSNFAAGTSNPAKEGSHLRFTVHAENDICYEPQTTEAKLFIAYIDIIDQVTGTILDTQRVAIIVPGKPSGGEED